MTTPERETPLTDANRMTERNGCITTFQGNEIVRADFARRLEKVAAELAEALNASWDHQDSCPALRHYAELQKEMK